MTKLTLKPGVNKYTGIGAEATERWLSSIELTKEQTITSKESIALIRNIRAAFPEQPNLGTAVVAAFGVRAMLNSLSKSDEKANAVSILNIIMRGGGYALVPLT
jgi:hypothetical protein